MINKSFSYERKKVDRMGRYFPTIDFALNEHVNSENYSNKKTTIVGKFHIGNSEFDVNLNEIDRIIETAEAVKTILHRKYRTGLIR